jgi:Flp pilus assembly protein TadB
MKRNLVLVVSMASAFAFAAAASAEDKERKRIRDPATHGVVETPEQQRDRIQLRDQLRTELKLQNEEVGALDRELPLYLQRGDRERVRQMIRENVQEGCRGECLGVSLRWMNRAMQGGFSDNEAQQFCRENVREQLRERAGLDDKELGARLEQRMQRRFETWRRDTERARERIHQPDKNRGAGGNQPERGRGAGQGGKKGGGGR